MARYIDANKLFQHIDGQTHLSKGKILNYIRENAMSEVVEVKHGEWEKVGVWGDTGSVNYRCTACKETTFNSDLFAYCPKCGARMSA